MDGVSVRNGNLKKGNSSHKVFENMKLHEHCGFSLFFFPLQHSVNLFFPPIVKMFFSYGLLPGGGGDSAGAGGGIIWIQSAA